MLNPRIISVLKRELKAKLASKTFIVMTILMPLIMFGGIALQIFISQDEGKSNLTIISESGALTMAFEKELMNSELTKDGKYTFAFSTLNRDALKNYLDDKKADLLDGKITGVIYIPVSSMKDKKIEYYSKSPTNLSMSRRLERPINKVLIENYFYNKALAPEELDFARRGIDFSGFKISKDNNVAKDEGGNLVLSILVAFLLYLSLLLSGQMMLQSVVEEKNNRIVEVILSSVSAREMMTGKILGATVTALIQMVIWLSPVILVISTTLFVLPPEFIFSITINHILYLLFNFAVGLLIYMSLFGMMGSIFDNAQDAQQGQMPLMMLIIIPFFIAISMSSNPNSPIANIAALLPFASIMVMPVKMTVVEVPMWQLALSVAVNLLTLIVVFPIAGKIYGVGILSTGKKPKWSEVIKWLKYKY